MKPKVTLYIPCHAYGCYLQEAVESVLSQLYTDWELIIINDGSMDNTEEIGTRYAGLYPGKIRFFSHSPAKGLQTCANIALRQARGEYLIRLDADDYLDEGALLILSSYLDKHTDVALVYSNYTYVNEDGRFLAQEHRKRIGDEVSLLDLPAHGACTMVRKRVLKSVGGYSEDFEAQDGHELWLKVINRYKVGNVTTPLFFYRQHGASLTKDEDRLLTARRRIKRRLAEERKGAVRPRILVIIPAKNTYKNLPNVVLAPLAGRPLLDYTLSAARKLKDIEHVVVTTDDDTVVDYCKEIDGIFALKRPPALSHRRVALSKVVAQTVILLEESYRLFSDVVVVLSVHSPLRKARHIQKALDTLMLYDVDSVLSVYEDYDVHYVHGKTGLTPLNAGMIQQIRLEREALYVDNGAIRVIWREVITDSDFVGKRVGHAVMAYRESFQIKEEADKWIIEELLMKEKSSGGKV